LYRDSMSDMCAMFSLWIKFSWNMSCFHALTTRFTAFNSHFPIEVVRNFLFVSFSRHYSIHDVENRPSGQCSS
jgi:hypothetical protein